MQVAQGGVEETAVSSVLTTQREGPRPGPQHPAQGGLVGSCPHCTIYLILLIHSFLKKKKKEVPAVSKTLY